MRVYTARERTRLKLTLRGKRLGLTLSEIKSLVDMYESPKDTSAQMKRFLTVLARHRETLEQQREDIEVTLAEIAAHEAECKRLLGGDVSAEEEPKPARKTAAKSAAKPAAKSSAGRAKQAA
jgi:DNA-binding transcriptional MerR regulator